MHGGRGHESVDGGREQRARPGRTGVARQTGVARLVAVFAVPALAITLLPGCTAEATTTPPTSPSVVTTPSPTPTPTPTPDASVKPERPAAMDEVNAAGAEAVAVYFLQLYPYVYATGDLEEWRDLSHPECVFCASVITNVEEQVAAGEVSSGGLIDVGTAIATEITVGSWFSVQVDGVQRAWAVHNAAGALVDEATGPSEHSFRLAVVRQDGSWLVRAVQVDDAPD